MLTIEERSAVDATVILCATCKQCCMVAVTDHIDAGIRREIGEAVAHGCEAKHMPVSEARTQKWCYCEKGVA